MNMSLSDSYVLHKSILPKVSYRNYNEKNNNKAHGTLMNSKFNIKFINSFKQEAIAFGRYFSVGPFLFAFGKAFGYESHVNGRRCIALGFKNKEKKKLEFIVPGLGADYLHVSFKYKDIH